MGGTGCGENRSLALVGRAMLSKIIKSNFLPMDGAVLPPCSLACSGPILESAVFMVGYRLYAETAMAPHSSVLAWRIPGTESLVGCRLWGRTESDTTEATQQQHRLYGKGKGDLLEKDLCQHATRLPGLLLSGPCGRPLSTHASAGDSHSQASLA